jgi:hypothetical protein
MLIQSLSESQLLMILRKYLTFEFYTHVFVC